MSGRKFGCLLNQLPLLTNVQTVSQITANKLRKKLSVMLNNRDTKYDFIMIFSSVEKG